MMVYVWLFALCHAQFGLSTKITIFGEVALSFWNSTVTGKVMEYHQVWGKISRKNGKKGVFYWHAYVNTKET